MAKTSLRTHMAVAGLPGVSQAFLLCNSCIGRVSVGLELSGMRSSGLSLQNVQ